MSEEEKSYLLCPYCQTFYEENEAHDCRISESEELEQERQWIENNRQKSEQEQLEEMIKPLTEKKSYKELLHATVLELAREDLQRSGRVLTRDQYEELARKTLLRQALREKYSKIPEKERLIYYRSLRDQYESWRRRLFGQYRNIRGENVYQCPVCPFSSKQMDETFRHFQGKHPKQYRWYIRVSSLLEGDHQYYRGKEYYPKKSKEEKGMDTLLGKKEELSKTEEDKAHLRNLTILTALTRRKEE